MNTTIGERLRTVADIVGGVKKLSDKWGMASPGLYNYFKGRTKPGADVLLRIYHLGFGLEWLITGKGMMFANNEAGRKMRRKHAQHARIETGKDVHSRLRYFAEVNFETIEEFADHLSKSAEEIQPYFETRKPSAGMLEELAALGCNLNWLLLGSGAQAADNNTKPAMTVEPARETYLKVTYSNEHFNVHEVTADQLSAEIAASKKK